MVEAAGAGGGFQTWTWAPCGGAWGGGGGTYGVAYGRRKDSSRKRGPGALERRKLRRQFKAATLKSHTSFKSWLRSRL